MSDLTKVSTASIDGVSAQNAMYLSGLVAGEALDAVSPCYVKSDGKVYKAVSTVLDEFSVTDDNDPADTVALNMPKVDGWTAKAYASGQHVTLFVGKGLRFSYGSSLTVATKLFVSDTAGKLADSAVATADIFPVAVVISATDIMTLR